MAQIELTNVYSGQLNWFSVTLQLPSGSVPAGQYPATITTTFNLGDGQVSTSVSNFTITVAADGKAVVTGPSVATALAVLNANTTGLLTIYPAGTILPTPSPVPSASPTPIPSATPSPVPTATPTPLPTATPNPTPTPSAPPGTFYADVILTPATCQQLGNTSTTVSFQASATASPPPGNTYLYGFSLVGLNGFTLSYPGPQKSGLIADGKANVTSVDFPPGSTISGEGGGISVNLYLSGGGGQVRSLNSPTGFAFAFTQIYAGAATCPPPK